MAAYQYIYVMKGLTKIYPGGRKVLENIWLSFLPGAKIGVLGHNGAGKSTLLQHHGRASTRTSPARPGRRTASPSGSCRRSRSSIPRKTCRTTSWRAWARRAALLKEFEDVSNAMADPDADFDTLLAKQAELQEKIDHADAWDVQRKVEIAMDALRCPPGDADVTKLSGGERRRVALCRLLLSSPDMLLLDEPTNHLDAESVAWLEQFLQEYKGTVVAVTHDRYFLDNVAGWILELDRGQGIPYEGNYSGWLEQKSKRLVQEEKTETARQRTLERELEWIRQSPKARQAKRKARVTAYESLLAQSNEKADGHRRHHDSARPAPRQPGDRGRQGEQGLRRPAADRRAELPPAAGRHRRRDRPERRRQDHPVPHDHRAGEARRRLVPRRRDREARLCRPVARQPRRPTRRCGRRSPTASTRSSSARRKMPSRAYVAAFNFKGADQQKKVGQLSGGERNRVHLAKMLKSGANVLLLDEPTNDLDVDTLRALEEALETFAGCAVIISHDRWFLDRIATHILAFEGDSHVEWFEGNYQDYEADRHKRPGVGGRPAPPDQVQTPGPSVG